MTQGNTLFLYKYKRKYNVKFANAVMKEMLKVNARQSQSPVSK